MVEGEMKRDAFSRQTVDDGRPLATGGYYARNCACSHPEIRSSPDQLFRVPFRDFCFLLSSRVLLLLSTSPLPPPLSLSSRRFKDYDIRKIYAFPSFKYLYITAVV